MFGGWYTDAKFKNAVSGVYKPTDDTTFYAKWEKIHVLVIVDQDKW